MAGIIMGSLTNIFRVELPPVKKIPTSIPEEAKDLLMTDFRYEEYTVKTNLGESFKLMLRKETHPDGRTLYVNLQDKPVFSITKPLPTHTIVIKMT